MENKKPDAGDVAPKPVEKEDAARSDPRKEAVSGDKPMDQGRSVPSQDLNSANDE